VRQAERHGWSAVEAASGEQALELLLSSGSVFDAVVCDLRMPGLSGMGLYEEVRRREPALLRRLLFLTGDMSSAEAIAFVARCNAPLFGKPFRFGDLLGRLREITGSA
jgi:DNA-binding response OmpR family regulator